MIDRFLGDAFFCPASFGVLFCSLVLGCRYTLLDRAVSGARFLTGGVFECDNSHRRSVPVLCMLYKIRCNPVALSKLMEREGRGNGKLVGPPILLGAPPILMELPYVGHQMLKFILI